MNTANEYLKYTELKSVTRDGVTVRHVETRHGAIARTYALWIEHAGKRRCYTSMSGPWSNGDIEYFLREAIKKTQRADFHFGQI